MRLNDEIDELRDKLNKSLVENVNYDVIYELSVQLDQLISEYYSVKENINRLDI